MSELAAVSGASGFIGSAVVRRLLRDGRPVRALIEPGAPTKNLDGLQGSIERVTVDVCDFAGMKRALHGAAAFYHLAAIQQGSDARPDRHLPREHGGDDDLAARGASSRRTARD